jgi:hypothetical protein
MRGPQIPDAERLDLIAIDLACKELATPRHFLPPPSAIH